MISTIKAAKLLGWASIAVGVTELVATRWLEEELGTEDHENVIRGFGVREITAGISILAQPGLNKSLAAGLWSRVIGDALDLFALGNIPRSRLGGRGYSSILATVLAVTGVDLIVAIFAQKDLLKSRSVATAARLRWHPVHARENGQMTQPSGAIGALELPSRERREASSLTVE